MSDPQIPRARITLKEKAWYLRHDNLKRLVRVIYVPILVSQQDQDLGFLSAIYSVVRRGRELNSTSTSEISLAGHQKGRKLREEGEGPPLPSSV